MKKFRIHTLIFANIKFRSFQYSMAFFIISIMSFAISAGMMMSASMRNGILSLRDKIGADIIIIPEGSGNISEDALFNGTPCTVTMDSSLVEEIKALPSVTEVSARLYLATLPGGSCCSSETQLIATDLKNDFLLKSWVGDIGLSKDEILLGSNYGLKAGSSIKYFGRDFKIKKVLDETGAGYDSSCFISMDAADEIMKDPAYAYIFGDNDAANSVSMIFLRTSDMDETIYCLDMFYPDSGISRFSFNSKLGDMENGIHDTEVFIIFFGAVICTLCALSLFALFSIFIYQRKHEIANMRLIGFAWHKVFFIYFSEGAAVSFAGACSGFLFYSLVSSSFKTAISKILHSPVIMPGLTINIKTFFTVSVIAVASLAVSIIIAFLKIAGMPLADLMKGGD